MRLCLGALVVVALGAVSRHPLALESRFAQGRSTVPAAQTAVPFDVGETLTYDISWSGLLTAGSATTRVVQRRPSFGATAYEITADGKPVPLIARLYPVYYKMDTLLDSATLLTQWTGLFADENGKTRQTHMRFDRPTRRVHYERTSPPPAPPSTTDFDVPATAQDGLSLLYALRTRDLKPGDRFSIAVADDGQVYSVDVAVGPTESFTVKYGALTGWKLGVTIVDSKQQPVGNNVAVWITSDARRLPAKIQANLPVGSFLLALRSAQ